MTPRKRPSLGPRVGNIRKDLTPETLRALAADPHFPVDGFWHSQLRAHAAAWKADRRKLEALAEAIEVYLAKVTNVALGMDPDQVALWDARGAALAAGEEK